MSYFLINLNIIINNNNSHHHQNAMINISNDPARKYKRNFVFLTLNFSSRKSIEVHLKLMN